jgi:hypothetical protein
MACNCSVQATTGYTPFYLMFGRQAKVPIDLIYGAPSPSMPVTAQLKEGLEKAYQQVRHKMGCSLKREKDFYDKRVHGDPFNEGEYVWLHSPATPQGHSKKLSLPWKGPYRVLKEDLGGHLPHSASKEQSTCSGALQSLKAVPSTSSPTNTTSYIKGPKGG